MKTLNNINNRIEEHEIPFQFSFHIYFTREYRKQREHPKNLSPEKYNIPKDIYFYLKNYLIARKTL